LTRPAGLECLRVFFAGSATRWGETSWNRLIGTPLAIAGCLLLLGAVLLALWLLWGF